MRREDEGKGTGEGALREPGPVGEPQWAPPLWATTKRRSCHHPFACSALCQASLPEKVAPRCCAKVAGVADCFKARFMSCQFR